MEPKIKENRWNKEIEHELFKRWTESKSFKFNPKSEKKIFAIDTPPPTANDRWHVGGAGAYSLLDMIARIMRMKGYEVLLPWCSDRNGLPMEVSVEKHYKIRMQNTPRDEFIKLTAKWAEDIGSQVTTIAKRMGMVCEYDGDFYYETDKPYYRSITQTTFIDLWKKGLVYVDNRPNNYCTGCGTTIADAEIEYEDIQTKLNHLKFKVKGSSEELIIATTRPEMLNACAAILFNPKDERYQKLEGKHAIVPIYNKEVPIISHPYAEIGFGTGLVMICSYGDYGDVRLFRELKLKPTSMINEQGRMTKEAGKYANLLIKEAREEIIKDLKQQGLIVKIEEILHRTPICWRSKTPIEFVSMPEFYLKQIEFVPQMQKIVKSLKFHPEMFRQTLQDWINSVSQDWVISRRRYYGTEIPIWYCKKCKEAWLPKPGKYYQPWKESPPEYAKCKCGSTEFVGETRTFDTWMDSSISELFITGYQRFPELFEKAFPCALRNQGKDIIRSWLYYTLLRAYQLFEKPAFEHIFVNGHGVDDHGEKMSKSKGNVVDPIPVLEKYGADAFRFWVASETSVGNDFRYSEERVQATQKFLTKLWNVSRFISMFPIKKTVKELQPADKWIMAELNKSIEKCEDGYDDFNFFIPANEVKHFAWSIFADHYVEMVKSRAYAGDNAALYTLHYCLQTILKLLAPVCPFITEKVWTELYSKESIHLEEFPKKNKKADGELLKFTEKISDFNSKIWKFKKEKGLALNSELAKVTAPAELEPFKDDLVAMHKIKEIVFKGSEISLE
jgi:valyl-tRNA synthetase